MTKEEELLIAVCQSYFNGSELALKDDVDFKAFSRLAKEHNLIGITHCVFNKNKKSPIPAGVRRIFEDRFFELVFLYETQTNALKELEAIFEQNGIRYVLFKGAVLRDMYAVPEARSMGDIDLLVDSNDVNRIKDVLTSNGFTAGTYNTSVYNFERNSILFEIHTRLVDDLEDDIYSNALDTATFDGVRGVLDDNLHLAYLINHTANHLRTSGAGIRFALDIAYMLKCGNIDNNKVFEILDKAGLTSFAQVILSVTKKWFGYGEGYIDDTSRIEEYLLKDGVFGNNKASSERALDRLMQVGALDNADDSPIKLKLKLAFPPYSALRKADYIGFLDGRPYLLPAAWAYRFAHNMKSPKHMLETVKSIDDENMTTLAKEELEFFEEIGLI